MDAQTATLSKRERTIADRYATGETYKDIAEALFIAPATVRNHLASIYRKLAVNSKLELISALTNVVPEADAPTRPVLQMLESDVLPPVTGASIAVMPFAGIGDDTDTELFSYGVTEDIHSDLTRFSDLFVSGRSSCNAISRESDDVREIARRLGVQSVLQGSVRTRDGSARITAELVDGASGGVVWSGKYDCELNDLFAAESEVASAIATTLSLKLDDVQYQRRKHCSPEQLSAYDWQVRGNRALDQGGAENLASAKECFTRALELEPDSAAAHAGLSMSYGYACWDLLTDDFAATLDKHRELAEKAVALDESNCKGHYALSCTHQLTGNFELADLHAARAVELNPSEYHNVCARGYTLMALGRFDESIATFNHSLRRNPLAPNSCLLAFGLMEYHEKNYAQSVIELTRLSGDYIRRFSCLAAGYGQLGYAEAALAAAEQFRDQLTTRPGAPAGTDATEWQAFWRKMYPFMDEETFDRLVGGMEKAGLPV